MKHPEPSAEVERLETHLASTQVDMLRLSQLLTEATEQAMQHLRERDAARAEVERLGRENARLAGIFKEAALAHASDAHAIIEREACAGLLEGRYAILEVALKETQFSAILEIAMRARMVELIAAARDIRARGESTSLVAGEYLGEGVLCALRDGKVWRHHGAEDQP